MSYQEKKHWITILIGVGSLVYYVIEVLGLKQGFASDIEAILPFILRVIIYSSVLGIVLAIVNWILNKEKHVEKDEMDRQIELKGFRNAYWACSGLLWVVLIGILLNEYALRNDGELYRMDTVNLAVHGTFFIAWAGILIESVTHVYLARRGVA